MPEAIQETYLDKPLRRVTIPYTLKRETSKYNKYMKWHLTFYYEEGGAVLSSEWFKTERQARESVDRMKTRDPFPIGNSYQILEPREIQVQGGDSGAR